VIATIAELVGELERTAGATASVGVSMPGSISAATGLVQNANSTMLNDRPFGRDVEAALGRPVRLANDAHCLALSESADGSGAGVESMFAVILGTGCGGSLIFGGRIVDGPNRCGGEWGHVPLPWAGSDEMPGPDCWCGRHGCLETWLAGPALSRDHARATQEELSAAQIAARAAHDDGARASLDRHLSRLGRGLAMVVNLVDPGVIVLGGGLSNMPHLYERLPAAIEPFIFAARPTVRILPPSHGDASGVRGAARLWDDARWGSSSWQG
jgi:fructokinase